MLRFRKRTFLLAAMAAIAAATAPPPAIAQSYPSKPITLIVPFPPGGAVDVMGRILATELKNELGQNVIVENRAGAGGTIGVGIASKAEPDGYTLAMGASPNTSMAFLSKRPMPYTYKDLTYIAQIGRAQLVLVARREFPASTPAQLLEKAGKEPGRVSFGDTTPDGFGAVPLTYGYFGKMAGGDFLGVTYSGEAPILTALMSGDLDTSIITYAAALPHIKAGNIKALAITSVVRLPGLPNVPTIAETLIPRYDAGSSYLLLGPAKMPADVVAKLNAAINKAIANPAIQKRMDDMGFVRTSGTSAEAATAVAEESRAWECVVSAIHSSQRPPRPCY